MTSGCYYRLHSDVPGVNKKNNCLVCRNIFHLSIARDITAAALERQTTSLVSVIEKTDG